MTDTPPSLVIRPLSPDRLAELLAFFEGPAFADNPPWRSCYCQYPHVDHTRVDWGTRTAAENRAAACERVAAGRMQGYLAYRDGELVGWCNAGPRALFDSLLHEPDPDAEGIGRIACFVVAKPWRRSGVARALLEASCAGLRAQGLAIAEATPLDREEESEAKNHLGPLRLYLDAGFTVHRPGESGTLVVRRALS